ncbi:MAG: HAD family hydrolase [Armatimonadota bacterium]|nr:HAD family hydrolase [Armatimonadota bacterium]
MAAAWPGLGAKGWQGKMIEQEVPGFGAVRVAHVVADMNGTLAVRGNLVPGVAERLRRLAERVAVHVVTADTYGAARRLFQELPVTLTILHQCGEAAAKEEYVRGLGADVVAALGNGRNDAPMLAAARVGIAVLEGEGCATAALQAADVLTRSILDALDLLLDPLRLKATLRS